MKNVSEEKYQEVLKEIDSEREHFEKHNLFYSPNSIWNGTLYRHGRFKPEFLLRNQIEELNDFLEYLFNHSEHCDHITYKEAYEEFEIHQRLINAMTKI